jgi:ATP diphosphatase
MATHSYDINDLKRLMERLRDPAYGCPWDLQQSYQSIAPFTLEECLELILRSTG